MNRTGISSAHSTGQHGYTQFPRQMSGPFRSSQCEFRSHYDLTPPGMRVHYAVIAVLALVSFAAIGVLLAWRG